MFFTKFKSSSTWECIAPVLQIRTSTSEPSATWLIAIISSLYYNFLVLKFAKHRRGQGMRFQNLKKDCYDTNVKFHHGFSSSDRMKEGKVFPAENIV